MKLIDILLLAIIALLLFMAVKGMKKRGTCSCGCDKCACKCGKKDNRTEKQK